MFQSSSRRNWFTKEGVDHYLEIEKENRMSTNGESFWELFMRFTEKHGLPGNTLMLDIGCGPGIVASDFIKKFAFKSLLAIDLSEPMLDCVPWYVDLETVRTTFQKADITKCRFDAHDASADLALSCRTLVYANSIENVFTETARVLKPGGLFAFNCFIHRQNFTETHFCERARYPMDTYAHSLKRIKELMALYGFKPLEERVELRSEMTSIPVSSQVFFLKKV